MVKNATISHLEVPDEKQRLEGLTGILSEGVYAYLKQKGRLCARNRNSSARRIELTTGGNRAGIGTQDWRCGVQRTKTLGALGKAKR